MAGGLLPVPAWCKGELGAIVNATSRDEGCSGSGADRSATIARSTIEQRATLPWYFSELVYRYPIHIRYADTPICHRYGYQRSIGKI
jgi:hypothetical protein